MIEPFENLQCNELREGMLALAQLDSLKKSQQRDTLQTGALHFRRASQYNLAEKLNLETIELGTQMGADNDIVRGNLSVVYREQGKYDACFNILDDGPRQRTSASNLASCLGQLGIAEFRKAVTLARKISNEKNASDTSKIRCAELFIRKGLTTIANDVIEELDESDFEEWWQTELITVRTRIKYEAFRSTLPTWQQCDRTEFEKIRKAAEDTFSVRKKRLGIVSCDTMNTLELLAEILEWSGVFASALKKYEYVWRIREHLLGLNHQMTLLAESRFLALQCRLKKTAPSEAVKRISRALQTLSKVLKNIGNDRIADMYSRMASCFVVMNDTVKASESYQKAINIQSAFAESEHWKVMCWRKLLTELTQNN